MEITDSHRKITGSRTDCYLAWDDLRKKGWKVHRAIYWEGRGRGFHAAIEMVRMWGGPDIKILGIELQCPSTEDFVASLMCSSSDFIGQQVSELIEFQPFR